MRHKEQIVRVIVHVIAQFLFVAISWVFTRYVLDPLGNALA